MKKLYLAYGSNLNMEQMRYRCSGVVVIGTAAIRNYELLFKGSGSGYYLTIERRRGGKVPVPHCGEYSEIIFDDIRYNVEKNEANDDDKTFSITSIFYICLKCGCISSEYEMKSQHSKWITASPEAYEIHRACFFWLTAWTSPWATWESIIMKYLRDQFVPARFKIAIQIFVKIDVFTRRKRDLVRRIRVCYAIGHFPFYFDVQQRVIPENVAGIAVWIVFGAVNTAGDNCRKLVRLLF